MNFSKSIPLKRLLILLALLSIKSIAGKYKNEEGKLAINLPSQSESESKQTKRYLIQSLPFGVVCHITSYLPFQQLLKRNSEQDLPFENYGFHVYFMPYSRVSTVFHRAYHLNFFEKYLIKALIGTSQYMKIVTKHRVALNDLDNFFDSTDDDYYSDDDDDKNNEHYPFNFLSIHNHTTINEEKNQIKEKIEGINFIIESESEKAEEKTMDALKLELKSLQEQLEKLEETKKEYSNLMNIALSGQTPQWLEKRFEFIKEHLKKREVKKFKIKNRKKA